MIGKALGTIASIVVMFCACICGLGLAFAENLLLWHWIISML